MVLSATPLHYLEKNTQASLLLGPQLQNCQPFTYKTGIQQDVHSHTLHGGCYGFVMKRWGRLPENTFFFFFNKWPQKTLDTKQTLCFWQSLKIISWTLALLNGTTFPSFLLRSCPTMQSLNVFQWKQLTACRNTF